VGPNVVGVGVLADAAPGFALVVAPAVLGDGGTHAAAGRDVGAELGVLQTLADRESLVGVPVQHLLHQVARVVAGVRNERLEADRGLLRP